VCGTPPIAPVGPLFAAIGMLDLLNAAAIKAFIALPVFSRRRGPEPRRKRWSFSSWLIDLGQETNSYSPPKY